MPQRVSGILNISQNSDHYHDCKRDPEQYEKSSEIFIVTPGVEMRHSSGVFNCWEHSVFLLCSDLLAG